MSLFSFLTLRLRLILCYGFLDGDYTQYLPWNKAPKSPLSFFELLKVLKKRKLKSIKEEIDMRV